MSKNDVKTSYGLYETPRCECCGTKQTTNRKVFTTWVDEKGQKWGTWDWEK